MSRTPLDQAHAAMTARPDDDKERLGFFERLADCEIFLMLDNGHETPMTFETSEGTFVLAFDTEDRLTQFAESAAPYAALSGRAVATMLAGNGVGIALNPEVAPSSMLIPADAMDWLQSLLAKAPKTQDRRPVEVRTPTAPPRLIQGLDSKLASAAGLASYAVLADVTYEDGEAALLLALFDPAPKAETALAKAVSEALIFSGQDDSVLDVAFFAATDPIAAKLASVGLRIDLPEPELPKPAQPEIPGSDPDKPPRLR